MKVKQIILIAFILIAKALHAQNEYKTLEVGDRAPSLTIQQWLKGEPVLDFKKGNVYVVEFSGTWCAPCRKAIPHLSELSKKYVGRITILSVYLENNNKEDLTDLRYVEQVRYMAEALGDKMDFTIAVDVPQQITKYMWGVNGVPRAFIVDRSGNLAWIGHPVDLDPVLKEMIEGNFDIEKTTQQQVSFREYLDNILKIAKKGQFQDALHGIDSLINVYPHNTWLHYQKFGILAIDNSEKAYAWLQWLLDTKIENFDWPHFIGGEFHKISLANRNYEIELKALDRAIEESETKYLSAYPLSMKAATYATIRDYKKAVESCQRAIEYSKVPGGNSNETERYESDLVIYKYCLMVREDKKNASIWVRTMIANKKVKIDSRLIGVVTEVPDYDLALELVDEALKVESNSKPYFLGRKSNIYAATGNFGKAVELCQQVIKMYNDKGMFGKVEEYENLLVEYKQRLKHN